MNAQAGPSFRRIASSLHRNAAESGGGLRSRRGTAAGRTLLMLLAVLLWPAAASVAATPAARVAGALTGFGNALTSAVGNAVDAAQNVYVVTSTGNVYKETFDATANSYTESLLFTTASGAGSGIAVDSTGANLVVGTGTGVAKYTGSGTSYALATSFGPFTGTVSPDLDTAGNVYIVNGTSGVLYKETVAGSGYTQTTLASGFVAPKYLAVDSGGNVFLNSGTTQIYKVSPSGTKTAQTINGLSGIAGLAVDRSGNLFLQGASDVLEAVPSGTDAYTLSDFYQYSGTGLSVDSLGDVYLNAGTQNAGTKLTVGPGYLNFGSVGPASPTRMTVAFTLLTSSATRLGTPAAVTQGLTGYDFTIAPGGTCQGADVVAGASCTVVVQFQPLASGSRVGAVNLPNSAGTVLASSFLGGVGSAPLAAYQSVTLLNTISTTLSQGRGITVDPAGNVFVANSTANQILKFAAGSTTATVLTTTGGCSPVGTAVDGAGNLYYTCNRDTNMYELVGGTGTPVAIPVGYDTDDHLSVDAAGNLYPTSYSGGAQGSPSNLFLKVAAGTHTVSVIATAPAAARFVGAVTDAAGNTFAPDYNNNILYELPAGANTLITLYSGAPLVAPHAIAEDAAGNLYVTTTTPNTSGVGASNLLRFAAGNYSATPAIVAVPGADSLAITPNGNFYTVYNNSTLAVYTRSLYALSFPDTAVGQTSATQTVTLENDGTAPLTLSPPASGANPSTSTNFSFAGTSTCPQLSSASAPATLAAGSTCTEVIAFQPTMAGSISGAMVTTDNSANVAGSTQTINLSGTGTAGTPTVSVPNVNGTLGQSVTLTATVSGGGVAPTGTLTFKVGSGAVGTAVCTTGTNAETCTATYPTASGVSAGDNTVTASFAADGNYNAATGTGTLTLAPAPTTSSVSSATNPSTFGAGVTFTGTVSSPYGTPTGTVSFLDGSAVLGTGTLDSNGKATLTSSTLLAGTHAISISYAGTSTFAASVASGINQVVNPASNYGDTLSSSNLAPSFGSPVMLTDTLAILGGTAPTGTVTFYSGSTVIGTGTLNANGVATMTISTLPVGSDVIKAIYPGDSNYSGMTSPLITEFVSKASVSNTLATNNASPSFGTSVTFTVHLPTVGGVAPTGTVTFSSGGAVLGTASLNGSGVATLSTTALPVGTDTVTASYAGDGNYSNSTSNSVTENVAKASGYSDVLTTSNANPAFGSSVNFTVTLGSVNNVFPTGTMTFTSNGTTLGTATLAKGVATLSTTALAVGSDAVQATFAGDGNFSSSTSNTITETVSKAPVASDVLTTSNASPSFGSSVTFTDTLAAVGGNSPSGTVNFYAGSTLLGTGTLSANGVATLTTASLPVGTSSVTAVYAGDGNFNTATSNAVSESVSKASIPSDVLTTSDPSPAFGSSVTFTDTLAAVNGVYPTGNVSFLSGTKLLGTGTLSASGMATLTTASLPVGSSSITAVYAGDASFNNATSNAITETVSKASGYGNVLSTSDASPAFGSSVTLTDTLAPVNGVYPTGSVTFYNSSTALGTGSLNAAGVATLTTGALPVGTDSITAVFAGDGSFAGSTSNAITETVSKASGYGDVLTTSNANPAFGSSVTLTNTLAAVNGAYPTGTVNFMSGSTSLGTGTLSATGVATLTTSSLPAGTVTITAVYAGDASFAGATSNAITETVSKAPVDTDVLTSSTAYSTYGHAVSFTNTLSTRGGTVPTGTVSFYNGSTLLGTATLDASGVATFSTTALPVGTASVKAVYGSDANFNSATSNVVGVNVAKIAASNLDSVTGSGVYGAASTPITVTIPYAGSTAPTGDILVADTHNESVTIAASTCTSSNGTLTCAGTLPTANEPVGSNPLTVSQASDALYEASTGTGTLTLGKVAATTGDSASGTGIYGAPATAVTVTIPYAGGATPTGAITLTDTHGNTVSISASGCAAANHLLTCTANLPTANEPVGANPVTVSQAADSNYGGSTGSGTVTINKAGGSAGDTASGSGTYGAATTPVTISIPYAGSLPPTGAISLQDTHGNTVSLPASSCTAAANTLSCSTNLPTATEPVGSNPVTVSQAADGNYTGSTGTGTITIARAPATTGDTANGSGTYGAATTSVVVTIPYAGAAPPSGAITVQDNLGNTVTIPAASCGSSGGALTCTAALPSANDPVGGNPLTVSQAADGNYSGSTGTGTLTIHPAGSRGDDSATGTGFYGAPATQVTVLIPFTGANAPTGAITVADGFGNAITVAASVCSASGNTLVCPASLPTAHEPVGSNPLSVAQAADASHAASTGTGVLTIHQAAATTSDTAIGTGTYGAPASPVTVTIPYAGVAAPTGVITVTDALGNAATSPAASCKAANQTLTCVLNLPSANEPLGANAISVTQAADPNYSSSTGTGTLTISAATVSPIGSPASSVQNVTITQGTPGTLLTVSISYSGVTPPSGAVAFTVADGAPVTATCSADAASEVCTASYPTASLVAGTYTITATEAADANYIAGSNTGTLTVETGTVSPLLDSVSNVANVQIAAGTPTATLTAQITYNGPIPTGGLTFSLPGGTPVAATCTAGPSPLTCTAAYPTATLAAGTYVITATEAADGSYPQGAATALLTITPDANTPVSPVLTTGSTVSNVLIPLGQATADLSATIQFTGPEPTGAVTFNVIGSPAGAVAATCSTGASPRVCTASYPTSTLGVGSYRIQANEAADATYPAGSGMGTLTVTDLIGGTGDTATGTGNYGDATSPLTVTIPYSGASAPAGAVTVSDGSGNSATVPASTCSTANGVLTCSVALPSANLPVGADSLHVTQAADAAYAATTGAGTLTIGKATATTGDTGTGTGTYGEPTTPITLTIPYAGTAAPTGAITLADGLGNTVAVTAASCTAASHTLTCTADLPTANEPVGANPFTITQAGDSNYLGSSGNGTVTIGQTAAAGNDTATGKGTYGAATSTVNVTIPFSGAAAPTGAITVADTLGNTVNIQPSGCSVLNGSLLCSAALPTANEPVGSNALTVSQAADANHSGSTGTGTLSIVKAPVTTDDTANGNGSYGAPTTPITVVIPYAGVAAPTGAITVADSLGNTVTAQASACSAAAGRLTCTLNLPTASEAIGPNPLTVSQAADSNYSGSTGTGTNILSKAATASADTLSGTGTYGAASTPVTLTIPYNGPTAPTGAITLTDGFGNTLTVQATACAATSNVLRCAADFPTASEPVGSNPVAITQAADAHYERSSGSGDIVLNKVPVTSADTASGTSLYGGATTPVTVTIPYTGKTAPTGAITVADANGNTVTVDASACSAGNGKLTCTVNLPTANDPVGSNPVTITQAPDANYSGSTGTGAILITRADATGNDRASGTGIYGAPTTAVTVTIPYTGSAAPTGAITLADTFGNLLTVQASTCAAAKGLLSCTINLPTASEPVGSNPVTVAQAADAQFSGSTGTGVVVINKAPATTGDTATGTGSYGAATTPVATTIPYAGAAAPTGAITVTDDQGHTVTVPASGCTARAGVLTCTANLPAAGLSVGSHDLKVTQAPDANYSGSTGLGTLQVTKATPTLAAPTVSPMNAPSSTPVTLTETVPAGETGTVTFFNGSTALGTATITNGVATLRDITLPTGTDVITATANGDANFAPATSPAVTDIVGGNATAVALSASQGTTTLGGPVTFSASITATSTSPVAGTVTFYDGTAVLGTGTVSNGVATLSTSSLPVGGHTITAKFVPATGSPLDGATSAALTETVQPAVSPITLTSSLNPAIISQSVTFSVNVPGTVPNTAPTGMVTFLSGSKVLGTAQLNASGGASLSTRDLPAGAQNITASYSGDANYAPSTSGTVTQSVADYSLGSTIPTVGADPGQKGVFNITIDPVAKVAYSAPVVLTVTGLPASFTASFAPGTLTPGAGGTTSTMTVQTFAQTLTAMQRQQHIKSLEAAAAWASLLPLLGLRRVRRRLPRGLLMLLLCLASFGAVAPLTGCGGGYFGPAPTSYTLTVTGTSGSLQRSTTVTLNVH